MAGGLPGVNVRNHFGTDAFYVHQIFATVWHDENAVKLNLNIDEQRRFVLIDGEGFAALDNAWGRRGWTRAHLEFVEPEDFLEAFKCAWARSAKKPRRPGRKKMVKTKKATKKR